MISPSADRSDACSERTRNGSPNRSGARGNMPAEFFTAINEQRSNRGLSRADDALQSFWSSLDCQDKSPSWAPRSCARNLPLTGTSGARAISPHGLSF